MILVGVAVCDTPSLDMISHVSSRGMCPTSPPPLLTLPPPPGYTGYITEGEALGMARKDRKMSYISDAVRGVCAALDQCFAAYDDGRYVSTSVRYPMDVAAVVDFSIVARGFEVCGSLAVVVDVVDWSGICFVVDLSGRSRYWLEHGPIEVGVSEVVWELVSACSGDDRFDLVVPSMESTTRGFRFDLAVA